MHNSLLLPRILALKDSSAFTVVIDSVEQSADRLVAEFLHNAPVATNVIYLNFETVRPPKRANHVVDGHQKTADFRSAIDKLIDGKSNLIVIDTLAFIPEAELFQLLFSLISNTTSVVAIYHSNLTSKSETASTLSTSHYPDTLSLLNYFATSLLTVSPLSDPNAMPHDVEKHNKQVSEWDVPLGLNGTVFEVSLDLRRKSGRGITVSYLVDSDTHKVTLDNRRAAETVDEQGLLKDLTTFNLTTSEKNKTAKDNVELPFLTSQQYGDGGVQGGAIVYQYEKDDDYDEEDPYEDPF